MMRISWDRDDHGYDPILFPRVRVLLNGELQLGVITADEEQGEIYSYDCDSKGNALADPLRPGLALATWKRGRVEIVMAQ